MAAGADESYESQSGENGVDESDYDEDLVYFDSNEEDSESSGEDEEIEREEPFVLWTTTAFPEPPEQVHQIPFNENPGPKRPSRVDGRVTELDYFQRYFTDELIQPMCLESTRYFEQQDKKYENLIAENPAKKSKYYEKKREWFRKTGRYTMARIKLILGISIGMGLCNKVSLNSYWRGSQKRNHNEIDNLLATPGFSKFISRDHFKFLLQFLHFANNEDLPARDSPNYDPLQAINPIINYLNWQFGRRYTMEEDISIDESLVGMKNRLPGGIRQYMPNKHHHRWGVKFYVLSEASTGYTFRIHVAKPIEKYEAPPTGIPLKNADKLSRTDHLVLHLLHGDPGRMEESVLRKGYSLGTDNYYTSIPLAKELFNLETKLTGTMRANRKHIPQELKIRLKPGESKYRRSGHLLMCAFREKKSNKKNILLLSTRTHADNIEITRCSGKDAVIPVMVDTYNHNMGGIDLGDQQIYQYMKEFRSYKWYKKIFFNLMYRSLLNAHVLYSKQEFPPISFLEFIRRVGSDLLEGNAEGNDNVQQQNAAKHTIRQLPKEPTANGKMWQKERNCKSCTDANRGRRRTTRECTACNVGVCTDCIPDHLKK